MNIFIIANSNHSYNFSFITCFLLVGTIQSWFFFCFFEFKEFFFGLLEFIDFFDFLIWYFFPFSHIGNIKCFTFKYYLIFFLSYFLSYFFFLFFFWIWKVLHFFEVSNQIIAFFLFINHALRWAGVDWVGHSHVKQNDTDCTNVYLYLIIVVVVSSLVHVIEIKFVLVELDM